MEQKKRDAKFEQKKGYMTNDPSPITPLAPHMPNQLNEIMKVEKIQINKPSRFNMPHFVKPMDISEIGNFNTTFPVLPSLAQITDNINSIHPQYLKPPP